MSKDFTIHHSPFAFHCAKPLRYIDHEINAFHKDFTSAGVRFCFIYPDVYEVGISHLGLKILYTIINQTSDGMADRCYTPWTDYGQWLLDKKIPLAALESKVPLADFDILCFTLPTELCYTNILYTLELAQIPLRRADRDDTHPIIIAGGINAVNPHPLSLFIDAFYIGEAEEGILTIKDIIKQYSSGDFQSPPSSGDFQSPLSSGDVLIATPTNPRIKILQALSSLDCIYVPECFSTDLRPQTLEDRKPNPTTPAPSPQLSTINYQLSTKKSIYSTFSTSRTTHFPQIVPLLQGTHDRHTAEIMRGCTRGCRFCQAGMFYRPVREKDPAIIIEQLCEDVKRSGWDSASLMSLSSSDYTAILPLLHCLMGKLAGTGVSLSLPSLRIDTLDNPLAELIQTLKKTGITLAPEAGTQRLRDIINKNLTEEEIINAIGFARNAGARLVKLYFMIGLPFETDEDIDGIIALVDKIITGKDMQINISLSPFVPKPFTPFQWVAMNTEKEVLEKALRIKQAYSRYKFVKVHYHTIELSFVEAVLCRGDYDTGCVIERAYQRGAKFDAWREYFDYNIWLDAAEDVGYDWYAPIEGYSLDDPLPWDNISIGVTKDFLKSEYHKAEQAVTTPDCRVSGCNGCGMEVCKIDNNLPNTDTTTIYHDVKDMCPSDIDQDNLKSVSTVSLQLSADKNSSLLTSHYPLYRVFYSKKNDLKYIGHLDFLRLIHRLLMISDLPIAFSQGFNPHPKTSFCPPLSSGIEGENEFFEIMLKTSDGRPQTTAPSNQSQTTAPSNQSQTTASSNQSQTTAPSNQLSTINYQLSTITPPPTSEYLLSELSKTPIKDLHFHTAICLTESDHYIPINEYDTEVLSVDFSHLNTIDFIKKLAEYMKNPIVTFTKERKGKERVVNLKDIIVDIYFKEDTLYITKKIAGASIFDILSVLFGISREEAEIFKIVRREICK